MASLGLTVFLALFAAVSLAVPNSQWSVYKNQHGKVYENPIEDAMRREIYERNKAKIKSFNAHESARASYSMGLNHMSDWTEEEFNATLGFRASKNQAEVERSAEGQRFLDELLNSNDPVPDSVDWRKVANRVSDVKDQGKCGSCWSFATTGLLEGQEIGHANKSGVPLSEQYLIDCGARNEGCAGGNMAYALDDIKDNGGIQDETSYPYSATDNICQYQRDHFVMSDTGAVVLNADDEKMLKVTVARYGPVAVGLSVTPNWASYQSGIFYDKDCKSYMPSHAVLVVGYGTDDKTGDDYWILKNSWSKKWGMDGYMYLARNRHNHCYVANYPVIAKF